VFIITWCMVETRTSVAGETYGRTRVNVWQTATDCVALKFLAFALYPMTSRIQRILQAIACSWHIHCNRCYFWRNCLSFRPTSFHIGLNILYITWCQNISETKFDMTADISSRQRLRSSSLSALIVPPTRLSTVGDRAFPVAASSTWNSLPHHVTSAPSLQTFKKRLKPFLFSCSFAS